MYRFNKVEVLFAGGSAKMDEFLLGGLVQAGLRRISCLKEPADLKELSGESRPDLLILNGSGRNTDVLDFCRALRSNMKGQNPFATVLTWNQRPTENDVLAAMQSGVDALISDPPSTRCVIGRISRSVWNRENFVIRGNYIGPNRPNDLELSNGVKSTLIKTPNSLKAKATGDEAAVSNIEQEIKTAIAVVNSHKLEERLEQIKYLASAIIWICREPTASSAIDTHAKALTKAISDIPNHLSGESLKEAKVTCNSIKGWLQSLNEDQLLSSKGGFGELEDLITSLVSICRKASGGLVKTPAPRNLFGVLKNVP